jgi:hypothetical protein
MSDFRIEKVRHPLEITLASGQRFDGHMFLEPAARNHSGVQDPRELLDEDASFFPFAVGGTLLLLAKDHVKLASYKVIPSPAAISPLMIDVRVTLADGTLIDGMVEVEPRSDSQRLLDYLNRFGGRFLSMTSDRAVHHLINRKMIAAVQQR